MVHSVPSCFCQNVQTYPGTAEEVSWSSVQQSQGKFTLQWTRMPQKKIEESQSISKSSESSNLLKSSSHQIFVSDEILDSSKNFSNFSTPGPAVLGDFFREDWLSGRSATYLTRKTHQMHQIPLALRDPYILAWEDGVAIFCKNSGSWQSHSYDDH